MNQSDYDFVNVREYGIYFLRMCMITKLNLSLDDLPNISEWERKLRMMELSFNDCLSINSSDIFKCLLYTNKTKSLQFSFNFLTSLEILCKEIPKTIETVPHLFYILLLFTILSVPIIYYIFYKFKSKTVEQHRVSFYRGTIQPEYKPDCQLD